MHPRTPDHATGLGLLGEIALIGDCWRVRKRVSHHYLSEYGFSLLSTLAAQYTAKARSLQHTLYAVTERTAKYGSARCGLSHNDTLAALADATMQCHEQGIMGGAQGVVDMIVHNDDIRKILESGGFVLEEVLNDAGFELKVRCIQIDVSRACVLLEAAFG